MRKMFGFVAIFGLIAFVADDATAQRQKGGGGGGFGGGMFGGRGGGGFFLLQNKGVQEELKITEEQTGKIKTAQEEINKKYPFTFGKKTDNPPSKEDREKLAKERTDATTKAIAEILTKEQSTRLKQIERQQNPAATLTTDEDAVKELKITDEQKEKIKGLQDDNQKEMRGLFGMGGMGGFSKENQEKMATLRKELKEKTLKVLTEDQTKKWSEMTGKPFEVVFTFGGGKGPNTKKKDD